MCWVVMAALLSPLMLTSTIIQTVIFSSRIDGCSMVIMGPADIVCCSRLSQAPKLCSNVFYMLFLALFFLLKLRTIIHPFIAQLLLSCGPCSLCMTLKLIWVIAVLFHLQSYAYAVSLSFYMLIWIVFKTTAVPQLLPVVPFGICTSSPDSRSAIARCLGILMPKERGSALPQALTKCFHLLQASYSDTQYHLYSK